MAHYASSAAREEMFLKSLKSLIKNTKYPYELTVIDNGGSRESTTFMIKMTEQGKINTFIKNANNMHHPYARNQGLDLAWGHYVAIVDDDIMFNEGWLTKCVEVLEAFPDEKLYATPIPYPKTNRYTLEKRTHNGMELAFSMRAGSNCFVIRRKDFDEIGKFSMHRTAGTFWTNRAVRLGYHSLVLPEGYATDMGLDIGYNHRKPIPIKLSLSNGRDIYFNADEFKRYNPRKEYYK